MQELRLLNAFLHCTLSSAPCTERELYSEVSAALMHWRGALRALHDARRLTKAREDRVRAIVASSVAFCGSDSRQCLDAAGALSAALVVAGSVYYGNSRSFEEELDDAIDPDIAHEMDSVIGEAEEILEELMDLFVEEHGAEPTEDEFLAWTESLKAQGAVAEKKAGKKSTPKKATTPAKKPAQKSTPAKPKAAKETKASTRRRPPTRSTPGKK